MGAPNKEMLSDGIMIIKSNYVFYVISYILLFFIAYEYYEIGINYLLEWMNIVVNGRIEQKIEILFYLLIIAPITEELIFRYFIFRLLKKLDIRLVIILSSIIFFIAHTKTDFSKLIVGIGLGIYYSKYKRIELNILIHFLINLFTVIIGVFSIKYLQFPASELFLIVLLPVVLILPNYSFWYQIIIKQLISLDKKESNNGNLITGESGSFIDNTE